MSRSPHVFAPVALLLFVSSSSWSSAQAAPQTLFRVDTLNDTVDANPGDGTCADADGSCSLRAAIQEANALGGGNVQLALGETYAITIVGALEDFSASGDLDVRVPIVLYGNRSTVDAGGLDRAFDIASTGSLVVSDLAVVNGLVTGESGGAFRSVSTLSMTRCTALNNVAVGIGASGGAVFNDGGVLNVESSVLSGGSAARAGGAIEANGGITTIEFSDLVGNFTGPSPGNGGGLHLTGSGEVRVRFSRVEDNMAASEGGGLWNSASGNMDVFVSEIAGNIAQGDMADNGGGGLFNDGGAMAVRFSQVRENAAANGSGSGGGIFNNGGILDIIQSGVFDNSARRAGGGIEALAGTTTVQDSLLIGNDTGPAPGNGGGLHLTGAGNVNVNDSRVSGNTATAEGGGLWNSGVGLMTVVRTVLETNRASGNAADQGGGGLFNDGGTMTVRRSTIVGNHADGTSGSGGGILNNQGTLLVSRTRIALNECSRAGGGIEANVGSTTLDLVQLFWNRTGPMPGNGGGFHLSGAGDVGITNSSVTLNEASNEGGGLWNSSTGTMVVTNTTIQDNTAPTGPDNFNQGGTFTIDGVPVP